MARTQLQVLDGGHIKVESGVPMPQGHGKRRADRPRLSDMKVGDSYFLPNKTHANAAAIRMESRADRIPIAARTVTENGVKGLRVWRVG